MRENITPQQTFDAIVVSKFNQWEWWGHHSIPWDTAEGTPDYWNFVMPVLDPVVDVMHRMLVTHNILIGAMRRIADGRVQRYVSWDTYEACMRFLNDGPEDAEFDENSADQVMQVATLGEVAFG
ncbi:hypothetical protein [Streptomyces malaysiensis]|uniref:hypothetical protein n=1 Tax=Streptomyces malaysiensis TaxID=92644 RepID=UPI0036B330BF